MSTLQGKAYHPANGSTEQIWGGFSWPCLFFGCFWYLYKGMWGWAAISFIVSIVTYGLGWLVFPFFANEQHAKSLLAKGYLTKKQWEEKQNPQASSNASNINTTASQALPIADELAKLAELRSKGILTEEEFASQKTRLLASR